jgi:hypothetical protein
MPVGLSAATYVLDCGRLRDIEAQVSDMCRMHATGLYRSAHAIAILVATGLSLSEVSVVEPLESHSGLYELPGSDVPPVDPVCSAV